MSILSISERQIFLDLMVGQKDLLNGDFDERKAAYQSIYEDFTKACPGRLSRQKVPKVCYAMINSCGIEKAGSWGGFAALGKAYVRPPVGTAPDVEPLPMSGSREKIDRDETSTKEGSPHSVTQIDSFTPDPMEIGRAEKTEYVSGGQAIDLRDEPKFLNDTDISTRVLVLVEEIRESASAYSRRYIRKPNATDTLCFAGSILSSQQSMETWATLSDRGLFIATMSAIVFEWVLSRDLINYNNIKEDLSNALSAYGEADQPVSQDSIEPLLGRMVDMRLRKETFRSQVIPAKAQELANRLAAVLSVIFEPREQSSVVMPNLPTQSLQSENGRPVSFKCLFVEALNFKLDLNLKGVSSRLKWPQPGANFDDTWMQIESSGKPADMDSAVVLFALTPSVTRQISQQASTSKREEDGEIFREIVLAKAIVYLREPKVNFHMVCSDKS